MTEALKWFTLAAEGGNTLSMLSLGWYFESEAPETAFKWIKKAAELGETNAMGLLACYYAEGIGTEKDAAKSEEWYRRAGDAED